MSRKVAVIVGSLRKESLNRKMAKALMGLSSEADLELEILEIADLPLYDQDLDEKPPKSWLDFKQGVRAAEAVLFVTPEYNRSIPAPLKNAIDVGSRPYGQSAWDKKPSAIVSVSPSPLGAFGANHHLRQCLVFLNSPVMQQPEAYIGKADQMFGEDGDFKDSKNKDFMQKFLVAFSEWIEAVSPSEAPTKSAPSKKDQKTQQETHA